MYEVESILWRNITPGDFFNIEKDLPPGPKGQLHIDLSPTEPVERFLGTDAQPGGGVTLPSVGAVGNIDLSAPLEFKRRPNGRWGIPRQNRLGNNHARHPAWTDSLGWPTPSTRPTSTADGQAALDSFGGLHVYIVRTVEGHYFAGFTVGDSRPVTWPEMLDPLFTAQRTRVGIIRPSHDRAALSPLAQEVFDAFRRRKSVLLYGPPGTGKTHAVAEVFSHVADPAASGLSTLYIDPSDRTAPFDLAVASSPLPTPTRTDWVTFHQDYGYEDFIIGLRPSGEGFTLEPQAGTLLDASLDVSTGSAGSALLVVDEINRGNVPKIFGDFLTYMDDDYRSKGAQPIPLRFAKLGGGEDGKTEPLRRADGSTETLEIPWFFPSEVYLLATMNSVDRAVAPLDTAMGRRFERIDAMPDVEFLASHLGVSLPEEAPSMTLDTLEVVDGDLGEGPDVPNAETDESEEEAPDSEENTDKLAADAGEAVDQEAEEADAWSAPFAAVLLLKYLNDEISERLGSDFELGHVYFMRVRTWADLARVWDLQIWPQLRDRFGVRVDQLAEILRVDNPKAGANYPFRKRRKGGRALTIGRVQSLPEATISASFEFLVVGPR